MLFRSYQRNADNPCDCSPLCASSSSRLAPAPWSTRSPETAAQAVTADFNWKLEVAEYAEPLGAIGIKSFDDLLKYYRAGHKALLAYVGQWPVLTDDRPTLESFLALPRDKQLDLATMPRDPREVLTD